MVKCMTDKEVRRLKRAELIEILFYLQKEIEELKQNNESLRRQLESLAATRTISDEDIERIAAAIKDVCRDAADSKKTAGAQRHGK